MKEITNSLLDELSGRAAASPRKRANYNLHAKLEDPVQRLLNAIEPGTYIRPHRHADPATWEVFFVVRGAAVCLTFGDSGEVKERIVLSAQGPNKGVELEPCTWHSIAALEAGTVFFEVKQGHYTPPQQENTAFWAPGEGAPDVPLFESWFRTAQPGELPPQKR